MKKYLFVILILSLSLLIGCTFSDSKSTTNASNKMLFDSVPLIIDGEFDSVTHQGLLYKSPTGGPVIVKNGVVMDKKGNKIKPISTGDAKDSPSNKKLDVATDKKTDDKDKNTEVVADIRSDAQNKKVETKKL